ncbi:MAG: hypothetical protein ABSG41_06325 [Bryobacteraceae bacterium]|jgi:hypothetical protein
MNKGGLGDFNKLSTEQQKRYRDDSCQKTKFALDHAIPIGFAPPLRTFAIPLGGGQIGTWTFSRSLGKIDGGTGCVLRLQSRVFIVTAEHVLAGYEERRDNGELLNWQVGKLPPFVPRVAWRGGRKYNPKGKDMVFLEISEQQAIEACAGRTHILSASTGLAPAAPQVGQTVLLAGYPNELREVDNGTVRVGAFSALCQVTRSTGDGTFKCRFEHSQLLSFDERPLPLKELNANVGGMSGGPVFAVENINSYPFVGVITERCRSVLDDSDTIVVESVEGVPSSFPPIA